MILTRHSKTIQFKERAHEIPLPRLKDSPLCPVLAVFNHFTLTPGVYRHGPAFVTAVQPVCALRRGTFIQHIKRALEAIGERGDYSGHSFRRGGASFAISRGMSTDDVRQIGDWRSEQYIKYAIHDIHKLKNLMLSACQDI